MDTATLSPLHTKSEKMPPSRRAGAGARLGGGAGDRGGGAQRAGGASLRTDNSAFRPPGRLRELRDFAHFSGGKRVLDSFFSFSHFSVRSINKPPRTRRSGAGPRGVGGRAQGGGRLCSLPHEKAHPFPWPRSLPFRRWPWLGRCGRPHPPGTPGPAPENPSPHHPPSRQGPPQRGGEHEGCGGGPGLPAPAQPVRDRVPS